MAKSRRIKAQTGDLYLASFDYDNQDYTDWEGEWAPRQGEECFLMQNVAANESGSCTLAIFDKIFHYNEDTSGIDISKLNVVAMYTTVKSPITWGLFKKIGRQRIPADMPYMAYKWIDDKTVCLHSMEGARLIESALPSIESMPREGLASTFSIYYDLAKVYIKGKRIDDVIHGERHILNAQIKPEAYVGNFFPEAWHNPDWLLSKIEEVIPQPTLEV